MGGRGAGGGEVVGESAAETLAGLEGGRAEAISFFVVFVGSLLVSKQRKQLATTNHLLSRQSSAMK